MTQSALGSQRPVNDDGELTQQLTPIFHALRCGGLHHAAAGDVDERANPDPPTVRLPSGMRPPMKALLRAVPSEGGTAGDGGTAGGAHRAEVHALQPGAHRAGAGSVGTGAHRAPDDEREPGTRRGQGHTGRHRTLRTIIH
ncbi:MAG: hypothetical protein M3Z25_22605 [Actinomycetota bacterium]|nr:hypothetical protein [Actinomycetota bacterium]